MYNEKTTDLLTRFYSSGSSDKKPVAGKLVDNVRYTAMVHHTRAGVDGSS